MLWDHPDDGENMQRFKNGIFLKMWVKNETRDTALPIVLILQITLIIIIGIAAFLGQPQSPPS